MESGGESLWWVGVILDCFATLAGTIGKQLIRYSHVTGKPMFFYLGLVGTAVVDPIFDVMAYSFAPQSIITPMAGMVVVWNVLLAPYTLGEPLSVARKIATLLVCVGTVGVGMSGSHEQVEYDAETLLVLFTSTNALLYYASFFVFYAICYSVIRGAGREARGLAIGSIGGSLAGNMFFTKACVELLACSIDGSCQPSPFTQIAIYIYFACTIVICLTALYWLSVGLEDFEALYMITVFEGTMIVSGAISGNIVMNESQHLNNEQIIIYTSSIMVILFGLWILLQGEKNTEKTPLTKVETPNEANTSFAGSPGAPSNMEDAKQPDETTKLTSGN